MLTIGSLSLSQPTILAPMASLTDRVFRQLIDEIGGAGLLVTELISAEGVRRRNKRTMEMLGNFPSKTPQFIQLFGNDAGVLSEAAQRVEAETCFAGIDINMGCPVSKVVRNGAGAGLLKDPRLVAAMITAVKKNIHLPLTVKLRLGWKEVNILQTMEAAQDAGADAILIHFRLATENYNTPARWEWAEAIRSRATVPLIGNGDIQTPEKAKEKLEILDGIAIGRGAVADPFIFAATAGEIIPCNRYPQMVRRLLELMEEYIPSRRWVFQLKCYLRYFHFRGLISRSQKREIFLAQEYPQAKELLLNRVDSLMGQG